MGFMAKRPRVALKNPYFVSMSRSMGPCPLCGRRLRLNGTLDPDTAVEVCDNDDCGYFQAVGCPSWARGKRVQEGESPFSVVEGGRMD